MRKILKIAIPVILLVLTFFILIQYNVKKVKQEEYIKNNEILSKKSNNFVVDKVIDYSNIMANDVNDGVQDYWRLNIFQFTDFAIYINVNNEIIDLKNEIKEVSIDNINIIEKPKIGETKFERIKLNDFAKSNNLQSENIDSIKFKVIENNQNIDENENLFKKNGELPLYFRYINNVSKDELITDISSKLEYNGSLLKRVNIPLESIKSKIGFRIKILTNSNETYVSNIELEIPISEEIFNGYQVISIDINKNFEYIS